ncbi:MAG: P1 family peptidase, partial [Oscillospiraceae bacterium]|nr:P1 family peptidase [Oscillospiraceae bacterium]
IHHSEESAVISLPQLNENKINDAFRAAAEATEEAVLNSMLCASPVTGWQGNLRHSLSEYMD